MSISLDYDVVVVGGGHAGSEASHACAKLSLKTCLYVLNKKMIANMPCNPSIGGSAKGIVVREIDALGGIMGKIADKHYMQIKILNLSKGPGVQSLRTQEDKNTYPKAVYDYLSQVKNLTIEEKEVVNIRKISDENNENIFKLSFKDSSECIYCKAVILCTGTHLESTILQGDKVASGGPDGEKPSHGLSQSLQNLGLKLFRLKTGTPPRILKDSINYSVLEEQYGMEGDIGFSFDTKESMPLKDQCVCHLTYTNEKTHKIINDNLKRSSMYSGLVKGVGPRYCPSIEDKIVRFADKERHLLFLEPESFTSDLVYLQGFSTSMPIDVQEEMVHSLLGLENAKIAKYAYAIEYDAIQPLEFGPNLMSYKVKGLFGAGQVIGTSGYEEAAALGLMAGINAFRYLNNEESFILSRDEAYIGVMIDDLVTKGSDEPYRLLSSRNEFRLICRSDNADIRLMKYGYELGLNSQARYDELLKKIANVDNVKSLLKSLHVSDNTEICDYIVSLGFEKPSGGTNYLELLKRQHVTYNKLKEYAKLPLLNSREITLLETEVKYEGYIKKAYEQADRVKEMENYLIPENIHYMEIDSISLEAREALSKMKPRTIGVASRITSVHPADVDTLVFYIKNLQHK